MYPGGAEIPERAFVIIGRSFAISAALTIDDPYAAGIIFAGGGRFGGHSLYLKDGTVHYVYNWLGEREQKLTAPTRLEKGPAVLASTSSKPDTTAPPPPEQHTCTSTGKSLPPPI